MLPLALAACLAWQAIPLEAIPHIQAGVEAQGQGRLRDAIAEFKKATELAPDFTAAFVSLGESYMRNGEYEAAIAPLKRVLDLNPQLIGAEQMLGYSLLSAGHANEAIPHLEKIHALDALGVAQMKTGKLAEAIISLQGALVKRPEDPDLLYFLGRASGLLSRQSFDALRESNPNSARAHQVLAETYGVLRNIQGAEKEYQEAIRLNPKLLGVRQELGELYAANNQWEKAEAEFLAETKMQPADAEVAFRLGNALLQQGKIKEARPELERANRLAPGMAETLYALGKAAALDGDKAASEKAWLGVIAAEKDSPVAAQAHFGLAGLYRQQGNAAKAESEMREFQRLQRPGAPAPK